MEIKEHFFWRRNDMRDFKNLPVGEMFIVGDKILVVKKENENNDFCSECFFRDLGIACIHAQNKKIMPFCSHDDRTDKQDVCFIEP